MGLSLKLESEDRENVFFFFWIVGENFRLMMVTLCLNALSLRYG